MEICCELPIPKPQPSLPISRSPSPILSSPFGNRARSYLGFVLRRLRSDVRVSPMRATSLESGPYWASAWARAPTTAS